MSWYRTGTIQGAAGSNVVIGTGTDFTDTASGVNAGDMLIVGGNFYEVSGVNSYNSLSLASSIATAIPAGTAYQIVTSAAVSNNALAKKVSAAMDRILASIANWMTMLTGTGTVTIKPYGTDTTASGLAWSTISSLVASALQYDTTQRTSVDTILPSAIYTILPSSAGAPVTTGGTLTNINHRGVAITQRYDTTDNRIFFRNGGLSGGNVTWSSWEEITKVSSLPTFGNAASRNVGTTAGTVAAGDDSRIVGALQRSGGTMSGALVANAGISTTTLGTNSFSGLASSFVLVGGSTAAANNIVAVTGDGNTGNTGYIGAFQFKWYSDIMYAGATRGAGSNISGYNIFFNGATTGAAKNWSFNVDGNATSQGNWVNGSDERHKSKIVPVPNPLAAVLSFRGATYDLLDGAPSVGLIAQDVEKCCKEAIKVYGNRVFSGNMVVENFKYLDTAGAGSAYSVEAIKELFEIIKILAKGNPEVEALINLVVNKRDEIRGIDLGDKPIYKDDNVGPSTPIGLLQEDSQALDIPEDGQGA